MISNSTFIRPGHPDGGLDLGAGVESTGVKKSIQINDPPLSVNMNLDKTLSSSIRRPLQTDESDVDFQPVTNKKSQRKQRKSKENHTTQIISTNLISADSEHGQNYALDDTGVLNRSTHGQTSFSPKQISISKESTRYAQTRYPFPPFVLRFSSGNVSLHQVKMCLIDHCVKNYQTNVQILNCRKTNTNLGNNQYDVLVYVQDVLSFSFLLDQAHWPNLVGNENFFFWSTPSIPPQLCLLIKNVDLFVNFNEFCDDLKVNYPEVKNIIRMKNKFQDDIKMVKLELTSPAVRDKLLNDKRISIN